MKALALALWIGLAAAQQAELVTVQLVDDRFVPDKLAFRSGVLYRLRLENHGKEMHEFTAPEFFKAIEVKNPEVLEPGLPEVLLHPGKARISTSSRASPAITRSSARTTTGTAWSARSPSNDGPRIKSQPRG